AGPRLLGLIFNWSLLGVLTTQIYIYNVNFPKDNRVAVYIVYMLDWAQTCSATYDGFQWFVYGWGDIPTLYGVFTDFLNIPILYSIIGSIVQLIRSIDLFWLAYMDIIAIWLTFAVVVLLSCLQLGASGTAGYYVTRSAGLIRAVGIRLGASVMVDTVIAISMTYFVRASHSLNFPLTTVILACAKSRGSAGTDAWYGVKVIRLTVETGTITAIAAIMDLLFFLKAHNALHQVTGVILCKIYSNALLVLFNNRLVMANASGTTVHTSQSLAFRAASRSQHETWNSRPTVLLDSMELQTSRSRDAREQAA
ncbi:hypothetical protein B0H13DRAFT_1611449, partial [Mycena leptocephala]